MDISKNYQSTANWGFSLGVPNLVYTIPSLWVRVIFTSQNFSRCHPLTTPSTASNMVTEDCSKVCNLCGWESHGPVAWSLFFGTFHQSWPLPGSIWFTGSKSRSLHLDYGKFWHQSMMNMKKIMPMAYMYISIYANISLSWHPCSAQNTCNHLWWSVPWAALTQLLLFASVFAWCSGDNHEWDARTQQRGQLDFLCQNTRHWQGLKKKNDSKNHLFVSSFSILSKVHLISAHPSHL